MNDPRYQYRPLSSERKEALSRAQLRRLGVPDGHCLIYGEHIPAHIAPRVREIAQTEARKNGRAKAELVAGAFAGTHLAYFMPHVTPPIDEFVLAFWRHMTIGWQSKRQRLCGGWYPTRYRKGRGWQAQFGSFRCYPRGTPELWTPILPPRDSDTRPKDGDAQQGSTGE
jgi:hypothetical protein